MSVIVTNTLMIPTCQRRLLPINFSLFSVISRPALKVSFVNWMYSNKFKLNAEKTDVFPVASTSRLSSVGRDSVDIGGKRIPFKSVQLGT